MPTGAPADMSRLVLQTHLPYHFYPMGMYAASKSKNLFSHTIDTEAFLR